MILGEYIALLEKQDPNKEVANGLGNPHSWRGSYDEISFEPIGKTTFGHMLTVARGAVGQTFRGWKGGGYLMTVTTDINVDRVGSWSDGGALRDMIEEFGQEAPDPVVRLIDLMANV